MITLATYFRALADTSRLRLIALMRSGPQCVEDLAVALAAPQPKISRHLAYLRKAGLVEGQREGRRIFYRIVHPRDDLERRIILELQRQLDGRPIVQADRKRLQKSSR